MKKLSIFFSLFFAAVSASTAQQTMGPWTNIGPVNAVSAGNANGMGRVSQIKFSPVNNQKLYAVSASGGLFISTNNGQTWTVTGTDKLPQGSCSSVCIDYTNDQVLYLSLGDANYYGNGYGIYKSTDGGVSWNPANNGIGYRMAVEILMDPTNHNNLVAATTDGIWKSTDAGASWTLKQSGVFRDMKAAPGSNTNLYAATATGFYKSSDFGGTWTQVTNGVSFPSGNYGTRIAVSAADGSRVYLVTVFPPGSGSINGTIMRSVDGGASFTTVYNNPGQCLVCYNESPTSGSQCDYDLDMTCNPQNANELILVAHCVWRSTDGGVTWSKRTDWWNQVHTDMHQIEFNPYNNAQLFCVNDGGIWLSTDPTAQTWTRRMDGLVANEIYYSAQNPINRGVFALGSQDDGEFYLNNNSWTNDGGGDWTAKCVFDYTSPGFIYYMDCGQRKSITQQGVNQSFNCPFTPNNNACLEFVPSLPGTGFIGYRGLWRSTTINTNNVAWTQIQSNSETVVDIVSSRADNNILYYVTAEGHFFRTDNALAASPVFTQFNTPGSTSVMASIATNKNNPNVVFLSCNAGVYRSGDKGATWTNISGTGLSGANIRKLIHDDYSTNERLFVNDGNYVHYKDNTTTAWTNHSSNQGLTSICSVSGMSIYNDGTSASVLRLATYGRGVWECPINNNVTSGATVSMFNDSTALPSGLKPLTGTIIGSAGTWGNNATKDKVFDGDNSTFFDAPSANNQWAGLDLGSAVNIRGFIYRPRSNYENRMQGGKFQVSTDSSFTNPVTIYTVPNTPLSFKDYFSVSADPNGAPARYIRFLSPDNGWGNIAEFKVYGANMSFVSSSAVNGSNLTGAVIGSSGSYNNDPSRTKSSAFDGDNNTFFDAPVANGQWVGLDLGSAKNIRYIRFRPRMNFEYRMQGGSFQVSSDANFTNPVTVYQVPAGTALLFQDYYIKSVDSNGISARYIRYLSPDNGWGNVAEIAVMAATNPVNTSFVSTSVVSGASLTGTVIGSNGSYNNDPSRTKTSVFDGDNNTFFDALTANGQWAGLDLGSTKNIRYIRFRPRVNFESRMQGGTFQISSDANFTTPVTIYQVPASTLSFQDYFIKSVDTNGVAARYIRYLSPDGGWGNVAEITVMAPAAAPVATFYSDRQYAGTAVSLPAGNYDVNDLISCGIGNDALSSMKIKNGYKVTLYSDAGFSGYTVCHTAADSLADAFLGYYNFNDLTSSLKIEPVGGTARVYTADETFSMVSTPNPATNKLQLHIEGAKAGEMRLQLLNLQGQVIVDRTESLREGANDLVLERGVWPSGIYIIKVSGAAGTTSQKIVFE